MRLVGRPLDGTGVSYLGSPSGSLLGQDKRSSGIHRPAAHAEISGFDLTSPLRPLPSRSTTTRKPITGDLTSHDTDSAVTDPWIGSNSEFPDTDSSIIDVNWIHHRWLVDAGVSFDSSLLDRVQLDLTEVALGIDEIRDIAMSMPVYDTGVGIDISQPDAIELGIGLDLAILLARENVFDAGVGYDPVPVSKPAQQPNETAYGYDGASELWAHLERASETNVGYDAVQAAAQQILEDLGVGLDDVVKAQRLGVWDSALGFDLLASEFVAVPVGDSSAGSDLSSLITRMTESSSGIGYDTSDNGFTPQATIGPTAYTSNANVSIPPWVRYIDAIALGAGGGGAGGNQIGGAGRGGNEGQWASWTGDRGVSRNTWTVINIVIGNGGGGGSRNNNGTGGTGGATTITLHGDTMTANGGTGGSGIAGVFTSERDGKSPGNHSRSGVSYTGGSGNSNEPGSGGEGGGGSAWPLNSGSGKSGAKGRAWLRFYM